MHIINELHDFNLQELKLNFQILQLLFQFTV
jgi:hypothetical protein